MSANPLVPFLVPILHRLSLKGVDRFFLSSTHPKSQSVACGNAAKSFMPESPQLTPMANELNVAYR
jgi:hypothetical protein